MCCALLSWWPAMPKIALNRPDGTDLLIHILDKCFWLLPFAIRSDATTAITNAGVSLAPRLGFLNGLLSTSYLLLEKYSSCFGQNGSRRLMRMVMWPPLSGRVLRPQLLHASRQGKWPPLPTPRGASEVSLCLPCAMNGLHGKFVAPCWS